MSDRSWVMVETFGPPHSGLPEGVEAMAFEEVVDCDDGTIQIVFGETAGGIDGSDVTEALEDLREHGFAYRAYDGGYHEVWSPEVEMWIPGMKNSLRSLIRSDGSQPVLELRDAIVYTDHMLVNLLTLLTAPLPVAVKMQRIARELERFAYTTNWRDKLTAVQARVNVLIDLYRAR